MNKEIKLLRTDLGEGRSKIYRVYVEVNIQYKIGMKDWSTLKTTSGVVISFSGSIYKGRMSQPLMFGQINDEISNILSFYPYHMLDVTRDDALAILTYWDLYHLSDLTPGTDRQMARVHSFCYDEAVKILKEEGLYIDNGYEYGTGWLYAPVPKSVVEDVVRIFKIDINESSWLEKYIKESDGYDVGTNDNVDGGAKP